MTPFDGDDLGRRCERPFGQVRRLAVVCHHAGVLEQHGCFQERALVSRRFAEVECRLWTGVRSERFTKELNMCPLVLRDDLREAAHVAGERALAERLRIKVSLEVFEEQCEVEDLAILGRRRGGRASGGRTCRRDRAGTEGKAGSEQRATPKRVATRRVR
jgi:hypothetical protein